MFESAEPSGDGHSTGEVDRRIERAVFTSAGDPTKANPPAFTIWMAGAGVKKGVTVGATDDLGFHIAEKPIHIRDLHATILHLLGFDHHKLAFRLQGLDFRLTGVEPAHVVRDILA